MAERGWKNDAILRQLSHEAASPNGATYDRAKILDEFQVVPFVKATKQFR